MTRRSSKADNSASSDYVHTEEDEDSTVTENSDNFLSDSSSSSGDSPKFERKRKYYSQDEAPFALRDYKLLDSSKPYRRVSKGIALVGEETESNSVDESDKNNFGSRYQEALMSEVRLAMKWRQEKDDTSMIKKRQKSLFVRRYIPEIGFVGDRVDGGKNYSSFATTFSNSDGDDPCSIDDDEDTFLMRNAPFLFRSLSYISCSPCRPDDNSWYENHFKRIKPRKRKGGVVGIVSSPKNRVILDVDSQSSVVEILSDSEISKNSGDISMDSDVDDETSKSNSRPTQYDPSLHGPPEKICKASTYFFKNIRLTTKRIVVKENSLLVREKSEASRKQLQYLMKKKMRETWLNLRDDERKKWSKLEREDSRRFRTQKALYEKWQCKDRQTHFYFLSKEGKRRDVVARIETRNDSRCPFCLAHCRNASGLATHCKLVHLNFDFLTAFDENKDLHIRVQPKKLNDSDQRNLCYIKQENTLLESNIPHVNVDVDMENNCARRLPKRQYYRARTMEPYEIDEWEVDSDDDEALDEWKRVHGEKALREIVDMTSKEKLFMNIWTAHISSSCVVSDESVPQRCLDFVKMNCNFLVREKLRDQLTVHLSILWDHTLISRDHVLACLEILDLHYDKVEKGSKF